ncbi:unnamed protein product [Peronospora belbahrii]|uniref:Uncharacterized protein n=1 Tax=Peronospora belbahrii TaxID=622444 RepID=A0ABN8CU52_9STRA|nr:unnamed protein product [Peronospora belbahrii]
MMVTAFLTSQYSSPFYFTRCNTTIEERLFLLKHCCIYYYYYKTKYSSSNNHINTSEWIQDLLHQLLVYQIPRL